MDAVSVDAPPGKEHWRTLPKEAGVERAIPRPVSHEELRKLARPAVWFVLPQPNGAEAWGPEPS
jgi:hypothetical protein